VRLLRGNEVKIYDVRQFRKDPSKDVKLQPGDRVELFLTPLRMARAGY
jgi:hypothetical protein